MFDEDIFLVSALQFYTQQADDKQKENFLEIIRANEANHSLLPKVIALCKK